MQCINILKLVVICFVTIIGGGLRAQSLAGFYTGQIKLSRQKAEMGMQLDIIEKDGVYNAVFRTRFIENNVITGCDNFLIGDLQNGVIIFRHLMNIKATQVHYGSCDYFTNLRLTLDKNSVDSTLSGTITGSDSFVFGKFKIEKIHEENSFSVKEEMDVVMRNLREEEILNEPLDSLRNQLMLTYRPTRFTDSISFVAGGELELYIDVPDADPFFKLTVLVNGSPVLEKKAPKQPPVKIKFDKLVEGDLKIVLLCSQILLNKNYPVVVSLQSEAGVQLVYTNVSTVQNTGILIQVKP